MTGFWQRVMVGWCWVVIVFGTVLMGAALPLTDRPTVVLFGVMGGAMPPMNEPLRFSVGLMGAVTLGWGLTLLAVSSVSRLLDQAQARALWRRIAVALGAWFVFDSIISIITGFAFNAVSNLALGLAFVLIIWRSAVLASRSVVARPAAWARSQAKDPTST